MIDLLSLKINKTLMNMCFIVCVFSQKKANLKTEVCWNSKLNYQLKVGCPLLEMKNIIFCSITFTTTTLYIYCSISTLFTIVDIPTFLAFISLELIRDSI